VPVPSHRLTPLKEHWLKIYTPVVEHLKLDIRFNVKSRNVEIRNPIPDDAIGSQHLQKAADFVKAFVYGFEVEDALALIRLDNLFVESFEVCTFLVFGIKYI
jgi:RNA-binding protein PNO1